MSSALSIPTSGGSVELSLDELGRLRELAMSNLYVFAKGILGLTWLVPHIHRPLCEMLQNSDNTRLGFTLPRGWLKSSLCSYAYPMWLAVRRPDVRILVAQNTHTNACKKLLHIKSTVEENALFRALWPELLPGARAVWRADSLTLARPSTFEEGTWEAAGIRTQVTGRHYDVIIEDDTVAPDLDDLGSTNLVPSKDDIDQAIGWHRLVPPLLVNPSESQVLVVGTRWFERDLISWIRENEKQYRFYMRACREDAVGAPARDGAVTYPERFDERVLAELETSCGPYIFSCLYLNTPIPSDKMTFRWEWFQSYETPSRNVVVYTTVDPAGGTEDAATSDTDYSVVMTCAKDLSSGHIYVLDYFRERCTPSALISAIFDHVRRYSPVKVGVESVALAKMLLYWIRERMRAESLFFMLEPITNNRTSKEARIQGLQPVFASHSISLRGWMVDLRNELTSFPHGQHDDLPDALSMQLGMWAMTKAVSVERERRDNPFSLEAIIDDIRGADAPVVGTLYETLATAPAGGLQW